jgi:hypothetical protein
MRRKTKITLFDFVDTPGKHKEREANRKREEERQKHVDRERQRGEEERAKNRQFGQVSLGETSLLHYIKKPAEKKRKQK